MNVDARGEVTPLRANAAGRSSVQHCCSTDERSQSRVPPSVAWQTKGPVETLGVAADDGAERVFFIPSTCLASSECDRISEILGR